LRRAYDYWQNRPGCNTLYGDKTAWCPSPKQQATVTTSWWERTFHHGCRSRHQYFYYPFPTSPRHKIKGTSPTANAWQLYSPRTRLGIGPSTLSLASLLPEEDRNAKVTLLLYFPGCTYPQRKCTCSIATKPHPEGNTSFYTGPPPSFTSTTLNHPATSRRENALKDTTGWNDTLDKRRIDRFNPHVQLYKGTSGTRSRNNCSIPTIPDDQCSIFMLMACLAALSILSHIFAHPFEKKQRPSVQRRGWGSIRSIPITNRPAPMTVRSAPTYATLYPDQHQNWTVMASATINSQMTSNPIQPMETGAIGQT
jgi:hypothetical protein